MTEHGWTVGQEVRVFDVNGRRPGEPSGGWLGEVVKVGRALFHVRYRNQVEAFRLETGRRNDIYSHRYVKSLDQVNRSIRAEYARETLRLYGFDLRNPSPSLDKLEAVAALLDSMEGADE